tara:strand:- start:1916 stop:2176 length:261 start_codon:yes stop_codon:yes gene_type:complete
MTIQTGMNYTVFSKEGCPYCDKIKQVLELTGSNFVVYTLGDQFDKDAFYGEFGEGSTFPQVVVDGKKLGGCVDTIQYLKEHQVIKS